MRFKQAIVRPPCDSFAQGITDANLGAPDLDLAQEQHRAYCAALEMCGISLVMLQPGQDHQVHLVKSDADQLQAGPIEVIVEGVGDEHLLGGCGGGGDVLETDGIEQRRVRRDETERLHAQGKLVVGIGAADAIGAAVAARI